jgi:hypothetical protein
MQRVFAAAAVLSVLVTVACSTGPLEMANIQLGRSLNQDRSIATITTTFRRSDTVYVSIQTKAAGWGTIGVRWKFGSQVIDEPTKQVDYSGPASTEFHLQNSGGFPEGDYSVEVFIDGQSVGTRAFVVFDRSK